MAPFAYPTSATADDTSPLAAAQVSSWRDAGFVLVDDLLPAELISTLRAAATHHFPTAGSDEAAAIRDFGSTVNFPSRLDGLNELTLHPRLLAAIHQLLDCPVTNLRLTQSDLWPKYGRAVTEGASDNQDQRIHFDYPNHSLVHPAPWDRPEAVELIVYLSDVNESGGSTAVVPRQGPDDPAYAWPLVSTPGVGKLRYVNDRASAEEYLADEQPELAEWRQALYEREQWTHFTPGTVLLYRHDTWHRGTPLHDGGFRLAHNLTFRRAECEWISTLHTGWTWAMYQDDLFMERLLANASVEQRCVLGFPEPGNAYWCPQTLQAVEARYGALGMDMTPYRQALPHG